MNPILFKISKYVVSLFSFRKPSTPGILNDPPPNYCAKIQCDGTYEDKSTGQKKKIQCSFHIQFGSPMEEFPANAAFQSGDTVTAVMWVTYDQLPFYLDVLRNEKPVHGFIDLNAPGRSYITTMSEPVGEGEN